MVSKTGKNCLQQVWSTDGAAGGGKKLVQALRHLRKVNNITDGHLEETPPPGMEGTAPALVPDLPEPPSDVPSTHVRLKIPFQN